MPHAISASSRGTCSTRPGRPRPLRTPRTAIGDTFRTWQSGGATPPASRRAPGGGRGGGGGGAGGPWVREVAPGNRGGAEKIEESCPAAKPSVRWGASFGSRPYALPHGSGTRETAEPAGKKPNRESQPAPEGFVSGNEGGGWGGRGRPSCGEAGFPRLCCRRAQRRNELRGGPLQ